MENWISTPKLTLSPKRSSLHMGFYSEPRSMTFYDLE